MTEFDEGPTVTVNKAALCEVLRSYRNLIRLHAEREPLSPAYYALTESLGESA